MKKIIFFIILSEVLFSLTLMVERNKNSIIPYNLRLGSNETLLNFSASYDTLTHKSDISANLHLYIKLYSKEKTENIKNKNKTKTLFYQYKSGLGIKTINKKLSLEFKNSFKLKYKKFILYEEFRPAIPFFFHESTTLEYKYNDKMFFLNKSFTYKTAGMNYSLGINFYKLFLPKFVRTITFSLNGNTSTPPLIYYYKISTSYRFSLMHKKYFFLNINPYILISKTYNFKIKPAIKFSLNYDF